MLPSTALFGLVLCALASRRISPFCATSYEGKFQGASFEKNSPIACYSRGLRLVPALAFSRGVLFRAVGLRRKETGTAYYCNTIWKLPCRVSWKLPWKWKLPYFVTKCGRLKKTRATSNEGEPGEFFL